MKTAIKTPDKLTIQIEDTQNSINAKSQELEKLRTDLNRFVESNFNLNVPICQEIKNDVGLSPSELLVEIERLEGLEKERLNKLANVKKASELFRSQINTVEQQLNSLQSELSRLENEQLWVNSYLP